jgi:hypothetical protein
MSHAAFCGGSQTMISWLTPGSGRAKPRLDLASLSYFADPPERLRQDFVCAHHTGDSVATHQVAESEEANLLAWDGPTFAFMLQTGPKRHSVLLARVDHADRAEPRSGRNFPLRAQRRLTPHSRTERSGTKCVTHHSFRVTQSQLAKGAKYVRRRPPWDCLPAGRRRSVSHMLHMSPDSYWSEAEPGNALERECHCGPGLMLASVSSWCTAASEIRCARPPGT